MTVRVTVKMSKEETVRALYVILERFSRPCVKYSDFPGRAIINATTQRVYASTIEAAVDMNRNKLNVHRSLGLGYGMTDGLGVPAHLFFKADGVWRRPCRELDRDICVDDAHMERVSLRVNQDVPLMLAVAQG